MYDVECPHCGEEHDLTDKLPDRACDDVVVECVCGATLTVGWYATAEVRNSKPSNTDSK